MKIKLPLYFTCILPLLAVNTHASLLTHTNIITFSDLTGSVQVQGKTQVGGNLTATDSIFASKPELQNTDTLQVAGTLNGSNIQVQNGNTLYATVNNADIQHHNGQLHQDPNLSFHSIQQALNQHSLNFSGLSSNGQLSGDHNNRLLSYSGEEDIAVFDLNSQFFSQNNGISFDLGTATSAVINVTGSIIDIHNAFNFLGNYQSQIHQLFWNFYQAEQITLNNKFIGALFATQADVINNGFDFEGTLIANSLTTTNNSVFRQYNFSLPQSSQVPEPSSLALFGIVFLLGLTCARKTASNRE